MGILSGGYQRAGSGIAKNARKKTGIKLFFEIFSRKIWALVKLNLLYFIACIPIVTIGPATAAFSRILKSYVQEKNAFIWSDFWEAFKKNFAKSFLIGILDVIFVVLIYLGFSVYPNLAKDNMFFYVPLAMCIVMSAVFIIMNFYIYLMIVSVELSLPTIIKNSFIITIMGLKKNILSLLLSAAIIIGIFIGSLYFPVLSILYPVIAVSFVGFIIAFNTYPMIEKYVINPYYENQGKTNPDYDYLKNPDEDDNTAPVFEDRGGTEKPVDFSKAKKSKKIIK